MAVETLAVLARIDGAHQELVVVDKRMRSVSTIRREGIKEGPKATAHLLLDAEVIFSACVGTVGPIGTLEVLEMAQGELQLNQTEPITISSADEVLVVLDH